VIALLTRISDIGLMVFGIVIVTVLLGQSE